MHLAGTGKRGGLGKAGKVCGLADESLAFVQKLHGEDFASLLDAKSLSRLVLRLAYNSAEPETLRWPKTSRRL